MAQLFANNAYGVLVGSINGAATALTLVSGHGARFPVLTGEDYFLATLVSTDTNGNENAWEVIRCTARATDQLTVVRGQEGTIATSWNSGTRIEVRLTKEGLDNKEATITAGTTDQYFRGDKTWRDFATDVRASVLTGLSTATNAVITAADTVLSALGKLQKQVSDNLTTLTSHTGNTSNPHGVTKAQVGLGNVDNTSDVDKPVSTATQTALNAKAPLTGVGTSGTWPISVTGNAATAPWAGISGKPSVIAAGADMAGARASIEAVAVDEVITPFITVSSTSQPAVDGVQYGLANAAATTLTLPPDPEVGSLVFVVVLNGRSDNILGRSGSLIGGLTENMTINNPKRPFAAKFVGGTTGWVIL